MNAYQTDVTETGRLRFCPKCRCRIERFEPCYGVKGGPFYHDPCPVLVWIVDSGGDMPGTAPYPYSTAAAAMAAADNRIVNCRVPLPMTDWEFGGKQIGMDFDSMFRRFFGVTMELTQGTG